MVVKMLTLHTTNLPLDRFPDYIDPVESVEGLQPRSEIMASKDLTASEGAPAPASKLLGKIKDEQLSRHPSPRPTHFTVSLDSNRVDGLDRHNGHRVLRSATVGYIAPEFGGKDEQMKTGKPIVVLYSLVSIGMLLTSLSQGNHHEGELDPCFTSG